jgi:hypothetical protein
MRELTQDETGAVRGGSYWTTSGFMGRPGRHRGGRFPDSIRYPGTGPLPPGHPPPDRIRSKSGKIRAGISVGSKGAEAEASISWGHTYEAEWNFDASCMRCHPGD